MATKYRVYKQLIPSNYDGMDPSWGRRQVWVAKLNASDTVDEFDTEEEAQAKATELQTADPTDRVYEVRTIVIEEPTEQTPE
jgi:hypothetical protein